MRPIISVVSSSDLTLPVDETQTLTLGQGYDALADEFSNSRVADWNEDSIVSESWSGGGQIVQTFIDIIEDVYEFKEALRISISASARGFGGRASAHYSLYRDVKINTNDVFALFYVTVLNETRTIVDPRLSKAAIEEWNNQKPSSRKDAMIRAFGDSYVSSITTGGEFLSVFRLHTSSRREKEQVKASASAKFGMFKASGDYNKLTEVFTGHSRTTSTFRRIGGAGALPGNDVKSLLEAARTFPDLVDPSKGGRPAQIYFTATPISKIPDANTNIDLRTRKAMEKLVDIARVQEVVQARLNDARFVVETPNLFKGMEPNEADVIVETLQEAGVELERLAEDVIEKRFENLSDMTVRDVDTLPQAPTVDEGEELPIKVTVAAFTHPNVLTDVTGQGGQWLSCMAMVGLTIECSDLADGTYLEYNVVDRKGTHSGWVRAGQTAKCAQMLTGIQIRVSGTNAARYSVRYGVKIQRVAASFYAQDGAMAYMIGWPINAVRISLTTT